jgi:hypothetical protein
MSHTVLHNVRLFARQHCGRVVALDTVGAVMIHTCPVRTVTYLGSVRVVEDSNARKIFFVYLSVCLPVA